MKQAFSNKGEKGLKILFPEYPDEKYLVTPNYIMEEMRQGNLFLSFYIRSMGAAGYVVYLHLPALSYLEEIRHRKVALLKLMSHSDLVAAVLKNTLSKNPDNNAPVIEKIDDFTRPAKDGKKEKVWVIREVVPIPFSLEALKNGTKECSILSCAVNELFNAANEYIMANYKVSIDYTIASWTMENAPKGIGTLIERCLKDNYLPSFIAKVDDIDNNKEFRDYLREQKVLVCVQNGQSYTYGMEIDRQNLDKTLHVMIMTDVLDKSTRHLDLCFYLKLVPEYGRLVPHLNLGSAQEMGSLLLNRIDTSPDAKIPESAFRHMPETSYVYFLSNNSNNGYSLEEYVKTGKKVEGFSFKDERMYTFDGSWLVSSHYLSLNPDTLWNDFSDISFSIDKGLTIVREILTYTPIYKKEFGIWVFKKLIDGATFWLNPGAKITKWLSKL